MKGSDQAQAFAAQIVDLNQFRKTRRVDLATIRPATVAEPSCAQAIVGQAIQAQAIALRSITVASGAVVSVGDLILDSATREHGRVVSIERLPLPMLAIRFLSGLRTVLAASLDTWGDEPDQVIGEYTPGQLGLAMAVDLGGQVRP